MLLFCLNFFRSTPVHVSAAPGINKQINFQGKLVNANGTNVTNGSYSIVFSIYTVSSAGSAIWTETQTPTVTDGIFQVALGSVTALPGSVDFNTDNIYLGIKVGADAEMTPRIRFGAVPQAFNAERLGGLNSSGFIQNTTTQQTADFNVSGTGRAGTSLTTPILQNSAANLSIQTATSGDINITPALATGLVNVLNGNLKVGNGTPGVALNGEDVYIEGTLEVDGAARFDGTVALNGVTTASTDVDMTFAGTENLSVTANGVPTADMVSISNSGQAVTTAGINAFAINYVGGAAAVEASAGRVDLQPGGTTGGTWSAWRLVHNATGPATGVTSQALKIEGPTTGGAGVFNGINIANIGATTTGGTVRGINITGTNSQAAGTIRGIQLNNLTGGAASEIGIDLGTGWDNLLTYNNGATVLINGSGQLNLGSVTGTLAVANGGTGQTTLQAAINSLSGLTTNGDLLYHNGTNSTRLAKGTNGQCLTSDATTILWGACGGAATTTLQQAYGNDADGSDAIIALTTADDSLIFRNPAASGTDSTFLATFEQLDTGAKDLVVLTQAGTGYALRINDDGTSTDSTPFVVDQNGNVGIGTTSATYKLTANNTVTSTAGDNFVGYFTSTYSPGTAGSGLINGASFRSTSSSANVGTAVLQGIQTYGMWQGTGTLSEARGFDSAAWNTNTGTISNAYGGMFGIVNSNAAGTITNAIALAINSGNNAGTIVSRVGIKINEQTGATNSSNLLIGPTIPTGTFSIYNSSNLNNYFAGNLGVGVDTPASTLHVASTNDPLTDLNDAADYQMTVKRSVATTGTSAGIAFTVSDTDTNIGASILHTRTNSNSMGNLGFYVKQVTTAGANPQLAMLITDVGSVGIGFTDPGTHKLAVNGTAYAQDGFFVASTGDLTFEGATNDDFELKIVPADVTADRTYTIPFSTAATDTFCLQTLGNCSGSATTLQQTYASDVDGSDTIIALTAADDSLIFRNPSSSGTDSGFIATFDQLNTGNVDGVRINNAGTGDLLELQDSGTAVLRIQDGGHMTASNSATGTTGTTEATARTNVTTITLTAAGSFANNDIIYINNAGQDYYTRIVSGGGTTTLTVSPAVSYDASAGVTKYNAQNIGATASDYSTLSDRFFQGYFLGGVVTGAGTTTLSDGNLNSTGSLTLQGQSGGDILIGNNSDILAVSAPTTTAINKREVIIDEGSTADTVSSTGARSSITRDPDNGYVYMTYQDNASEIMLMRCMTTDCKVKRQTLIRNLGTTAYSSVKVGSDGFPRIASGANATGAGNGLMYTRCLDKDCTNAVSTLVDQPTSTATGLYVDLEIGSDGFARIAHYDGTNRDLRFVQCTNADCTTSTITNVDSAGEVGQWLSMKLGSDGFARISYNDIINDDLLFVECTNASCSTKNGPTVVDNTSSDVGLNTALDLNSSNLARIAYFDNTNDDLKYAECTNASCSTNNKSVVNATVQSNDPEISMALTSGDRARIAYESSTAGLTINECTNISCSTSNLQLVDSSAGIDDAAIVLDSSGFAMVAYQGGTGADLIYVQCTNASCSTKNGPLAMDGTGIINNGYRSAQALGTDGFSRIVYLARDGIRYVRCTDADCATFTTSFIETAPSATAATMSIAIGSDGFARIVYNSSSNLLRMAQCNDDNCSSPTLTTIDATVTNYWGSSMAIASDGFVRVAYIRGNAVAMFAQCTNASCSTRTTNTIVASVVGGTNTDNIALVLGQDGFARIATVESTAGLSLVRCTNQACSSVVTRDLDTAGNAEGRLAIALGSDGFPRITFYDDSNGTVNRDVGFIRCVDDDCTAPVISSITTTDNNPSANFPTGLILVGDAPRVLYRAGTSLYMARCTDTSCRTFVTSTIGATLGDTTPSGVSMVATNEGLARITYFYDSTSTAVSAPQDSLNYIKCADQACIETNTVSYSGGTNIGSTTQYFNALYVSKTYSKESLVNGFDVAENYYVDDTSIEAMDIVAIKQGTTVEKASIGANTAVAGVVSTKPGITLSEWEEDERTRPVALVGRVPVKVKGLIAIGDAISISDIPGVGQKATGNYMIVGYALDAHTEEGQGSIEIFVNLAPPSAYEQLQGGSLMLSRINVTNASLENLEAVTVTVTGKLVLRSHIYSEGAAPVAEKNINLGSSIGVLAASIEIDGTDTAGTLTLIAGSNPASGTLAKVSFNKNYEKMPRIILSAVNEEGLSLPVFARKVDGGFEIVTNGTPQAGKTYQFDYIIIGSESVSTSQP